MEIHSEQDILHRTEKRHQDWRRGEFIEIDMEQRQQIWRRWALMGGEVDGTMGLGELS